ncbi:MAG: hypothetical protein ACW98Y_20155 [Candidatus Thorarchaeota archaeon]|jgi:hypothetical protein
MAQIESTQTLQRFKLGYQNSIRTLTRNLDAKTARRATAVTRSLILSLLEDLQNKIHSTEIMFQNLGWRNKYNIHRSSHLSQKVIYQEYGIIERLVDLDVIEMKESPTRWGKQKYHYRINGDFIRDWLLVEI